jgi:hypothetical protein
MRGKRRSAVLSLCAALPPVVAWNLWSWSHRAPAHDLVTLYYTDYVGYYLSDVSWGSLPTLLWTNLDVLTSSIGGLLVFGIDDSFIGKSVLRVLACASIAGAVRLARRSGFTSYHAYALGYGLLLLSWNYTPDERFLLPVAPALLAGLFAELENLLRTIRVSLRRPGQRIAAVAVALALAPLAGVYVQGTYSALCQGLPGMIARNRRELDRRLPLYRWIRAHLPGAVLAYRDPLVYLYAATSSGRLVVPPRLLYSGDRPALEAHLRTLPAVARAHGLDHVVLSENDLELELGPNERAWAHKLMRSLPELEPVFQSDAGSVYRIRR